MRPSFAIYLSSSSLRQRKLRSFLTVGGMAVGVSLIVFLVSLGFGLQRLIRDQITNVEALTVLNVSKGDSTLLQLNQNVIDSFQKINNVQDVSASISLSGQVAHQDSSTDVAVYGISPKFLSLEGIKLSSGADFSTDDAAELIITSTALNLVGIETSPKAIGTKVTLKIQVPKVAGSNATEDFTQKDLPMTIVGIVNDQELTITYVPIKFLENLGFPAAYSEAKVKVGAEALKDYNAAKVKVTDQSKLPEVRKQIEALGYQVDSVADTVGQVDKIFMVFQIVVGGFGAIAMFVAALGALNTLTVSLLERTREIGLMKAFGATSGDIYQLFMSEALLMGITGSILGVGLGIGAGTLTDLALRYLANRLGGQAVSIFYTPPLFILVLFGFVVIVSLVTGMYPSRRAATIRVLDALRYE